MTKLAFKRMILLTLVAASLLSAVGPSLSLSAQGAAEANKALVQRLYTELVQGADLTVADSLIAPDLVVHTSDNASGRQAFVNDWQTVRTALPDLKVTVHTLIAENDLVFVRATLSGTHQGEWMGIAATGKAVAYDSMSIFRVLNGVITEQWAVADTNALMQQISPIAAPSGQTPPATPVADGPAGATTGAANAEANKELVRALYAVFSGGDINALNTIVAENYIQHNPLAGQGREGLRQFITSNTGTGGAAIEQIVAEGDYVAVYTTATLSVADMTGMAPPGGAAPMAPPAGAPTPSGSFTLRTIDLFRIENGQLAEHWDILGGLPAMGGNMPGMPPRP
jgi:predicted SnoaL-like aldol condensation-catalyzing enzyme